MSFARCYKSVASTIEPDQLPVKSPDGPICYHRSFHSCCCRRGYV